VIKKAIFFDCDGTLLDTLQDIHEALNLTLIDAQKPTVSIDQTRTFVGNGLKNVMKRALNQDDVDDALANFHAHYSKGLIVHSTPYEGVLDFLVELKSQGYILGMISNKSDDYIQRLANHFFNQLFDVVIGERTDLNRKPHADMLVYALSQTQCQAQDIFFVGDSLVDAEFIKGNQLDGALLTYGFDDASLLVPTGLPCFENIASLRAWFLSHISP